MFVGAAFQTRETVTVSVEIAMIVRNAPNVGPPPEVVTTIISPIETEAPSPAFNTILAVVDPA